MPITLLQALEAEDHLAANKILSENPAEASIRDGDNRAAIHYAAEMNNVYTFRRVLDADPSLVDCQDSSGFTPLFVCVTAGNVDVLTVLLERESQLDHVDFDKHTAVHWAVVCGQVETLKELLKAGAPASTPDVHVS
jgi:ankyrin repeat protein